ncbi:Wzz/FepE/Etk N-terminal domain-containing protein [Mucilaginibacter lacusdianchii]|uniref:Wzz/FepE/Etk N-terminal domain-containing protein n=1 Tax=Mucilaginibacter lacusdianchii TaxID=2684211 RepID=UPI00131AB78D|nr:Wzz/FepE/Etk N-terminal domain-containing protein [Mucilaginibacter sp. JXJ CY 39]
MQREVLRDQEEITLKEVILKSRRLIYDLLRNWIYIVIAIIIGCVAGVFYASFKHYIYTAKCTFVLEEGESQSKLRSYSGIASMMGIDAGGSSGLFQGDNIIELYKSRSMIEKTLLSRATIKGKPQLLIDRYIEANGLRKFWAEKDPAVKNIQFDTDKARFTIKHDSIITQVVNDINKNYMEVERPDKNLNIINVTVKGGDEPFVKEFNDRIVTNVNAFYVQTKTKKILDNIALLKRQTDSLRNAMSSSMRGVAAAADANPNPNPALQSLRVPSQRRQVDVQANQTIYAEAVANLEVSKMSLRNESPLIQIIDSPLYPLEKAKLSKTKAAIMGGLLAFILTTVFLVTRRFFNNILS